MAGGFRIDYTSVKGYRGIDSFVVEVAYGKRAPIQDSFTVSVE
jgi:hypothetical protein